MRVGMRQGSAMSATATATPMAAEMNKRACSFHSRATSFNSLGPRRFEAESLDLDFFNRQSHLIGAACDVLAHAFRNQTLLSWNAAPPNGAIESAPVNELMPRPSA